MKPWAIIQELRNTTGSLDKVNILRRHRRSLKNILRYTYSPYIRYHIRDIPFDVEGKGFDTISAKTFKLLNDIVIRRITGNNARLMLFNHMETLRPDEAKVLKLVVSKNLDIGANVKLINRAYGYELIKAHKVMLAHRFDKSYMSWPSLATIKIDGIRATYRKGIFYTRNGHKVVGLDHLRDMLEFSRSDWHLDGELYIPGVRFDVMSGIIRSLKTAKPNVRYEVFDTRHDYEMPQRERLDWLAKHFPAFPGRFAIERVAYQEVKNLDQLWNTFRIARLQGHEGIVVKDPRAPYVEKRSRFWMKMKPLVSKEYQIIGYFEGEGKYVGMLGGFIIRVGKTEVRVGSGFSDGERKQIWEEPELYLKKWATIESMEKTATGRLRHPIYKSVRWDI